jgi:hypothetical protein
VSELNEMVEGFCSNHRVDDADTKRLVYKAFYHGVFHGFNSSRTAIAGLIADAQVAHTEAWNVCYPLPATDSPQ